MANFSFLCREVKSNKNGLAPIELSIVIPTAEKKRTYITLPVKCNPTEFKEKLQSNNNNEILEYVSSVRNKLTAYLAQMQEKGIAFTADNIKEYFKTGGVKLYPLTQMRDEFLVWKKKGMQLNALSINQFRQYEITFNYFYSFIGKNVEVKTITTQQAEDFVMYLRLNCNLQSVTAAKKIGYICSMFNFALRSGYIKTNPFAFVKVEKKVKEVKPLTTEEYVKIMDVELSEKLGKVRDLFVFQCETGCAFSDAQSITFCDIERDENGELYVNKPRKKTGIPFFAVLSPLAMNILKKYNYSLDFISNQKCNEYLKQIATICGITKPLHSHIARHTAATNLLNSGVRLETVAAVLGHTTTRQTAHYAKLCKATVINEVQTARNKPTAKVLKVGNW